MKNTLSVFNELAQYALENESLEGVSKQIPPEELHDFLDLEVKDEPSHDAQLIQLLKQLIKYTPKTASSLFFNQLFGGRKPAATLGDLLAVMLNNSMYTYKVAGPMVELEKVILTKVCQLIDYPIESYGTFATGGSMCNFMAMLMARDKSDPAIKTSGISKQLIFYTSTTSHYSISKNAAFIGVGRDNIRLIPVDEDGKMSAKALETQISIDQKNGLHPSFINATAGTTVLGVFDPIEAIAKISKKHNLWLHVDGAYCGGVIFSEHHKYLIKGVNHSDSFSFNAHKMLGTPLTCSIFVTQHKKQLYASFSNEAEYLYQTDTNDYNPGLTSFQCGRRNDALKFWTLWKSIGSIGLESMVNTQFELSKIAQNYISNHKDYKLYSPSNSISVCFNYKSIPAKTICSTLYQNSKLMVGHGQFNAISFVRMVTINSSLKAQDIYTFFKIIEAEFSES
ncbi:MAG: cysteine synthase [Bacteroidetes bacterium MedPE-SWsnd-G2]|nr:MAG: cysteine synthase [Bacteroidetes bacterium MedPE-SWsnd-G2]